jgi:FtsH-binding integral membrane protein
MDTPAALGTEAAGLGCGLGRGLGDHEEKAMSESLSYGAAGPAAGDRTRTLFGQTMAYVAVTTGFFALGCYLGRSLSEGWAFVWFIVAFACLISMRFAVRRSGGLAAGLLLVVGTALGLAMAPVMVYYASTDPRVLWQAGGATALFIAGFGAAGYATRRDLSGLARVCFWALIALIVLGIVLIFVHIPGGELIWSILGLVIFAGLTMFDFQRLRRSGDMDSAPLIAASIFLDALNVFLFFLRIFSRD